MDVSTPAQAPLARRVLARLGSGLLTLAAVLGAVSIALVIAGATMQMSLIMFKTGSMSPTIPAGSVALVREIAGDAIEVGDVVTVERPGKLPVTHRVIEIIAVDGRTATFRMQGDANADPDPQPYRASEVRLVLGSVPGVARVVVLFQSPVLLGAVTLLASALVIWAFWPREGREPGAH